MPFAAALSTASQTARAIEEVCARGLEHLTHAVNDRIEVAAHLSLRLKPKLGHVDHEHGGAQSESNAAAPVARAITLAQIAQMFEQRSSHLIG